MAYKDKNESWEESEEGKKRRAKKVIYVHLHLDQSETEEGEDSDEKDRKKVKVEDDEIEKSIRKGQEAAWKKLELEINAASTKVPKIVGGVNDNIEVKSNDDDEATSLLFKQGQKSTIIEERKEEESTRIKTSTSMSFPDIQSILPSEFRIGTRLIESTGGQGNAKDVERQEEKQLLITTDEQRK